MIINILRLVVVILIVISNNSAIAGIGKLIKNVFPKGTMSNSTSAKIVQEQSAGHYMGGSVVIKSPANQNLQLIQVRSPSCSMGGLPCGAQFEFLGGGISMISGSELMSYLKTLPANAATYAGMMAIKNMCPQCQDLLEWLDEKADWINEMANMECKDMQKLMDGMLPQEWSKDKALRQSSSIMNNEKKDMAQIQKTSKKDTNKAITNNELDESQLGDNFNLVWKALGKKAGKKEGSTEFKELLMSISGTIIGTKDEKGNKLAKHMVSLVSKDLIKQLVTGDGNEKVKLYHCDDKDKCLKPVMQDTVLDKDSFLYNRVQKILTSIVNKIKINQGSFTAEEETLIALSSLQLILKIEMDLANYADSSNVVHNQSEFIEALSYDVVIGYLQSLLTEVQESIGEFAHAQMGDRQKIKDFEDNARDIMRTLSIIRSESYKRYNIISNTKSRTAMDVKVYEQNFESFLGEQRLP